MSDSLKLPNTQELLEYIRNCTQPYFLTVTLKPKLYKYSSVTQLELTNHDLFTILYQTTASYHCVAEHTTAGNVHYHIIFDTINSHSAILLINRLKKNKNYGFVKLDKDISNQLKCAEYMTKDLYSTAKIFTSVNGHRPYYYMTAQWWRQITNC